jgi:hypothetical protein
MVANAASVGRRWLWWRENKMRERVQLDEAAGRLGKVFRACRGIGCGGAGAERGAVMVNLGR